MKEDYIYLIILVSIASVAYGVCHLIGDVIDHRERMDEAQAKIDKAKAESYIEKQGD